MKKIMFNDRYRLTQAVIEGRKTMTRRIELSPNIGYKLDIGIPFSIRNIVILRTTAACAN